MSKKDLTDMSIAELKERKDELGDDDYGVGTDHIDEELSRREEQRAKETELLDMKIQLEQAKDAGLTDDPTVKRVQERVAELEEELHPDPRADLARAADIREDRLVDLTDSEVEQARNHVESINMAAGSSNTAMKTVLEEHTEDLAALLEPHDLEVADLTSVEDSIGDGVTVSDLYNDE
jgi:hypothetical protein